ncbi:S-locus glycoprotein domain-containing protein [Artemisia annua]|uniref:Receptor-like serine/threonine-protein kinase n=1 Tax=Artemisia annua TaxID=35608 RepID=A0A2U1NQJ3_ARTAN|nr:S-locus glycoprotein domain-containing protein [Artemisia annua]
MHLPFLFLLLLVTLSYTSLIAIASSSPSVLNQGSSLFVEKEDHLVSPNGIFTAGFHRVGQNAFCFAIWFSEAMSDGNHTVVWMANRDEPVNGKRSKFSLWKDGNLVLKDASRRIWSSDTKSSLPLQLQLLDSGNLVLIHLNKKLYLWQSFNSPTDTILPNQLFTKDTVLISSKSSTNLSSGFYKFYFDNDNVIRLLYNSDEVTSVFWPLPYLQIWEVGRTTYNNTRSAMLTSEGRFWSADNLVFITSDYNSTIQRRLTLDVDGNIRVYSLSRGNWIVSWQAISQPCAIHGICGPNSLCTYSPALGRRCTCMHGYKAKNHSDLSFGCAPTFDINSNQENYEFVKLPHVEFYGFDNQYIESSTLKQCKKACLNDSNCKAIQFNFHKDSGHFRCYVKTLLFNGNYLGTPFDTYLKLPKTEIKSFNQHVPNQSRLDCPNSVIELRRTYEKKSTNGSLKFMLWFSIILGVVEVTSFMFFFYIAQKPSGATNQNYLAIATGFRRFSYEEIVKASHKFRDEIGRGGGGIVYKGILPDNRVVAIKLLHEAIQGEAEFLAEMSTIGRINHKNLIETYGYCAEGKHRILVYEYMENGSLAGKIGSNQLDWLKRFEIAVGVAKGLAYLHEECLEWVLHCDVKPHNVLLDADFNPKVADFGLSKLFHQDATNNSNFSKIRGTRGYMAPEWVFNLPITSKVDVYSYGMVVLEMITGRSSTCDQSNDDNERVDQKRLVSWVREKVHKARDRESCTESQFLEILDPAIVRAEIEEEQMKNLLNVALQCVEEDRDARPTMSEVVKMLLNHETDD